MRNEVKAPVIKVIFSLIKKKKRLVSYNVLLSIIDSFIPVTQVILLGYVVQQLVSKSSTSVLYLVIYLFTYFVKYVTEFLKNKYQLKLKLEFAQVVEEEVINKISDTSLNSRLDPKYNDSFSAIESALSPGQLSDMIVKLVESSFVFIAVIMLIFTLSSISFYIPITMLLLFIIVFPLQVKANNKYRESLFSDSREKNIINSIENGIFSKLGYIEMNVMGYHRWIKETLIEKYNIYRAKRVKETIKLESKSHLLNGIWQLCPPFMTLIIILTNAVSVSGVVILFGATYQIVSRMSKLVDSFSQLQQSIGIFRKMIAFMNEDYPKANHRLFIPSETEYINCENVYFSYPNNAHTISKINVEINKGDIICIVGENGSGKSTLVKLITGVLSPSGGNLEYEGNCRVPKASAFFQNFIKLESSIRENIVIGTDKLISDDHIIKALKDAQGDFAIDLGIDTSLDCDFGGINLSGGQWQRIGLARTFVKENGLIILDEPTASLDPIAEIELYTKVLEKYRDRTIILVSHRLTATLLADKILVVNQGEIIESGTHTDLMKLHGMYQKLFNVQARPYLNYYQSKKY